MLARDASNGAYVAWAAGPPGSQDIYAQHLLNNGNIAWSANGIPVCTAANNQNLPHIVSDGIGGAYLTWNDNRNSPTSNPQQRRVFVQHLMTTGVDETWTVNGVRACPNIEAGQSIPMICSDGEVGAIVAWNDQRVSAVRDIYAQRITVTGSLLWNVDGQPVTTATADQTLFGADVSAGVTYVTQFSEAQSSSLVPDGAGGCLVAWTDWRSAGTTGPDIYIQRLTSAGAVASGWAANGIGVCTDPANQAAPTVLSDGAGGAFASWWDRRSGVFVQHVTAAGALDGGNLALSNASASNVFTVGVQSGTGAIFFWSDDRDSTGSKVYAARVQTSPIFSLDFTWPPVLSLQTGAGNYGPETAVTDGAGGAFVTFAHDVNYLITGADLSSQRVYAAGILQSDPVAVIDGPGADAAINIVNPVTFLGSFTDADGGGHTAQWTFGNLLLDLGPVGSPLSTQYSFSEPGAYPVTFSVTDACGGIGTATEVSGAPARVLIYESSPLVDGGNINATTGTWSGVSWIDVDGDGFQDIYATNNGSACNLSHNNGDGTWSDATGSGPLTGGGHVVSGVWGDYDNDGDLDVYLTKDLGEANQLLRNDGGSGFIDVTSGPLGDTGNGAGAAWADYDRDGFIDLYISNRTGTSKLLRNVGAVSFQDVTAGPLAIAGDGRGAAWGDFDQDGDPDLFALDTSGNRLYRNDGGSFTNATTVVLNGPGGTGAAWGDYDNDGDLDLFATGVTPSSRLYRNEGFGEFIDATYGIMNQPGHTTPAWGDYNQDGRLDLFVGRTTAMHRVFINLGGGAFVNVGTFGSGNAASSAWGDADNDGDLDLCLAVSGGQIKLIRNDWAGPRQWLHVNLVGSASNRSAIGTRVRAVAGDLVQVREVSGGSGNAQNSLTLEFGFGVVPQVDTLEVIWPSGSRQMLLGISPLALAPDQTLTIREAEFSDLTTATLEGGGKGAGVAWGDYDNDEDQDLYVTQWGLANKLFRNEGGAFVDVTPPLLADTGNGSGAAWGDYDNDGDGDLYLVNSGQANKLFRNDGSGVFADVTTPPLGITGSGTSALWWDFDQDGLPDLYLTQDGSDSNKLFRNLGTGSFVDASVAGIDWARNTQSAAAGDYDNDGDLDIALANNGFANKVLRNDGNTIFADITSGSLPSMVGPWVGVAWGDYDQDGDLDLFFTNEGGPNALFRNDGPGTFAHVTSGPLTGTGSGKTVAWGDYENDGDLDLFVSNFSVPSQIFRNDGGGLFADATTGAIGVTTLGAGGAWADYDEDGDLDLYVASGGPVGGGVNRLIRNDVANGNHWLELDLVGTVSNRSAIGARTRVVSGSLRQIQEVSGGSGFLSQNSLTLEFGLGTRTVVDTIEVLWPSGRSQVLTDQAADERITIVEQIDAPGGGTFPLTIWNAPADDGESSSLGMSVEGVGDLNGDGFDDVLVGTNQQKALVYLGGAIGETAPDLVLTGQINFGSRVAHAGDVNGDGFDDWLVAAAPQSSSGQNDYGRVYLYLGGSTLNASPDLVMSGENENDWFGRTIGGVGDLNHDGFDDWAVGAPFNDAGGVDAGRLYVYFGGSASNASPDVSLTGTTQEAFGGFGNGFSGRGDLNGDGTDDLAVLSVGAYYGYGTVRVYFGGAAFNSVPDWTITSQGSSEFHRYQSVYIVGDVNRDGFDDLAIDDYSEDGGCSYSSIFFGGTAPNANADFILTTCYENALIPLVGIGDLNADGFADFAAGDSRAVQGGRRGAVKVFFGKNTLSTTPDLILRGETPLSSFGSTLAPAGDVNNDGLADLLVGDSDYILPGTPMRGRAYVFLGRSDWSDVTPGAMATVGYGSGVAWADYDKDGYLDLFMTNSPQDAFQKNKLFKGNGTESFIDVTTPELADVGGHGAAWGDFDNDADLDLLVTNGPTLPNALFRNDAFTFHNVASGALAALGYFRNGVWGDYDLDGDLDIYLANFVSVNGSADKLLRQDPGPTFVDVTTLPLGDLASGTGAAWADYDNDGDLDLYLANADAANKLYRNDRTNGFADVTSGPLGNTGFSQGVAWGDYDNDGDLDLYVANYGQANKLLRNDGGGFFADVTSGPLGDTGAGEGVAWGDVDLDGDLDLYLANDTSGTNKLLRNEGFGVFVDATTGGLKIPGHTAGVAWGDYDRDGDIDLYAAGAQAAGHLVRNDQATGNHWFQVGLAGYLSNFAAIGARVQVKTGSLSQVREISGGSGIFSQNSLIAAFGLGTATTVDSLIIHWPSGGSEVHTNVAVDQILYLNESQFTDVTTSPLADQLFGSAVAWGDYDNDGDEDLFFANSAAQPNRLFRNDAGNLVDATPAPMNVVVAGYGAAWADYDNDADLDLCQTGDDLIQLYRNDGGGNFTSSSIGSFVTGGAWRGVGWADYDQDGDLDLFVANQNLENKLLRNDGGGVFSDATNGQLLVPTPGFAVAWADYDGDLDPDLCLTHSTGGDKLFKNEGGGVFSEVLSPPIGTTDDSRSASWGDYDNDGDLDLYLSNFQAPNQLCRNDGGTFVATGILAYSGTSQGSSWGDADLDGDLDLYLAGGANRFFRNDGAGLFVDASTGLLGGPGEASGTAWADYDQDGDLDLSVTNTTFPPKLLRNEVARTNHWLNVKLMGVLSNRSAIGARVRARVGSVSQIREVDGGSGYGSQPSLPVEFGLGAATSVDTLEIRWPSGAVQVLKNVSSNQQITIVEPSGTPDVASIDKTAAPNTGLTTITLTGQRLDGNNLTVSLTGPATIPGTISTVSHNSLTVSFNLTGAPVAAYNVSLTNSLGSDTLPASFLVHPGGYTLFRSTASTGPDLDPAFPRTEGPQDTLLFVSDRGSGANLYIKHPFVQDNVPLTALTNLGNVSSPSLSPDGRKVVFESGGNIYILDLQTMAAPTLLSSPGTQPEWSPTGERIAFAKLVDATRSAICTIFPNGTNFEQLSFPLDPSSDRSPTWSPDGQTVAFVRDDGTGNTAISTFTYFIGPGSFMYTLSGIADISWSPDGQWLAVAANALSGPYHIYVFNPNEPTAGSIQLTNGNVNETKPCWNADGSALAYVSDQVGNPDLHVMSSIADLVDVDGDLVPTAQDVCPSSFLTVGQVDRDFDGCADLTSSFRFIRFWGPDSGPIEYQVSAAGDPRITDGSELTDLQAACNTWMGSSGVSVSAGYGNQGPAKVVTGDRLNSITFEDERGYIPGTLAVTFSTVAEGDTVIEGRWYRPGEIVDADILFNARDFHFSTSTTIPTANAYDLRAVATHEFGHFFGLSHSAIKSSTMYAVVPRNTSAWSLEKDDLGLIRRSYPNDLPPVLSIEGRVLRPDGTTPVPGAVVLAIASSAPLDTLQMTVTGLDGTYRFYEVDRSFRVWVTPLDGSGGVNGMTPSFINSTLLFLAQTDFDPEYWDQATENNHDQGAPGFVTVRPGPTITNANILLNIDIAPPQVVTTFPAQGDTSFAPTSAITIGFNEAIDLTSVSGTQISLKNLSTGAGVPGTAALLEQDLVLAFTPTTPLAFSTFYRLTLRTGIKDVAGNPLADSLTVQFRTRHQPSVSLAAISPSSASSGGAVVIYGAGFDPNPAHDLISFNGVTVNPTAATLDRLYAIVPPGAATGQVTVTVNGIPSSGLGFSVLAPRAPPSANLIGQFAFPLAKPQKMDLSADGSMLYVATDRGLHAVSAAPSLGATEVEILIPGGCTGVVALPSGNRVLAVGPTSPGLRVIDTNSNLLVKSVDLSGIPLEIAVVPGGREVLVSFRNKLALLDIPAGLNDPAFGHSMREWSYPASPFLGPVAASRDGNTFIAATGDNRFAIFERDMDGTPAASLTTGTSPREIAASADGQSLIGVDLAGTVVKFDRFGTRFSSASGGGGYVGVTVSPEGTYGYAADLILNRIDVLDMKTAAALPIGSFTTGIDPIDITVSPNGQFIYVLTEGSRRVEAYDTIDGPQLATVSPASGGNNAYITLTGKNFNPTANLNTVSMGGTLLTPISVNAAGTSLVVRQTSSVVANDISVTTGGKISNTLSYRRLTQTDPGNFALMPSFSAGTQSPQSLVRTPDGRLLIARGADGSLVALGEAPNRAGFHRILATFGPTASGLAGSGPMVVTPDGKKLYAGDPTTSRVKVFWIDPDAQVPIGTLGTVQNGSNPAIVDPVSLVVTPDGTRLYVCSRVDNRLVEVNTVTNVVAASITGTFTVPTIVTVHPNGTRAYVLFQDGGPQLGVFDIDPGSGTYRTRLASTALSGGVTAMHQLLAAPDGDHVAALVQVGTSYQLRWLTTASLAAAGSLNVGNGPGKPIAVLNQTGTLGFVLDPVSGTLKTVALPSFSFTGLPLANAAFLTGKALALSIEEARLYVVSGSAVHLTDLSHATSLAFVSGTNQMGVENKPLTFPIVVRASAAEGTPVVFEAVGTGTFGGPDAFGYAALDATGAAMANFQPGSGGGTRTLRAKLSGSTIETSVTVLPDTALVPPQLLSTSPVAGATQGVLTSIGFAFSKAIHPSTVSASTCPIKLLGSGIPIAGTYHFAEDQRRITFIPDGPLSYGATYVAEATAGLNDYNGNPLTNPTTISFYTESAPVIVRLDALTPSAATVGDPVVIAGDGFEALPSANIVKFGDVVATVGRADPQALMVFVPPGAQSGPLTVVARGQTSNALDFDVLVPSPVPIVDLSTSVSVPTSGNQVVVTPDTLRAYMTSPEGNTTVPILIGPRVSESAIPVGIYPLGLAISPDGTRLYVANYFSNDVSVVDVEVGSAMFQKRISSFSVATRPIAAAANPNGRELYIATAEANGEVLVIDTDPDGNPYTAKKSIETGSSNQTVTVTADGGQLIIGTAFGITLVNLTENYGAKASIDTGSSSKSVTVTSDGGYAIVLTTTGLLLILDIQEPEFGTAKASIETGSTSRAVTVSPDGGTVYVSTSDGRIFVYALVLGGDSGSAQADGSQAGFAFIPVDTLLVGENLSGMAFAGRDELLVVDSGERAIHLLGAAVTPFDCNETPTVYTETMGEFVSYDSLFVNLPAGARQLRATISWLPNSPPHHLGFKLFKQGTGKLVAKSGGSSDPDSLLAQGLAPGSYVFEVHRTSPQGTVLDWTVNVFICVDSVTSVPDDGRTARPGLLQSFPNPFRAGGSPARIRFALKEAGNVRLEIYDIRGARVRSLAREWMEAGEHEIRWDGATDQGGSAATGLYFYRLEVKGAFIETRRMVLLR